VIIFIIPLTKTGNDILWESQCSNLLFIYWCWRY